jgi:multidrug efflux pump subunit AcrA (membrane-fusion protein)
MISIDFKRNTTMKYRILLFIPMLFFAACGESEKPAVADSAPIQYEGAPENAREVIGIGRVEPEQDIIQLATQDGGVVRRLPIQEGDQVVAGAILLELEKSVAAAKLPQIRARAATQQAQLAADEKAVSEAETRLTNLQKNLTRSQNLFDKNVETAQNRDNAQFDVQNQQATVERLRAAAQVGRTRLEEFKSELAIAGRELEQKTVKAPVGGRILSISTQVGNALPPQSTFAELAPDGRTIVRCEVDELLADRVQVGQSAVIRAFGTGKTIAEGAVLYAAPLLKKKSLFTETTGEQEDRRVREVKILLRDPKNLLLNARVECVISL